MTSPSPEQPLGVALDRPTGSPPTRIALIVGVLFVITFISAIAGLLLYDPVLNDPDYILGAGADTRVSLGAFCEVILVIANIGTAVVLFPILRRQSEVLALGYVASRVLEGAMIAVGIVSVLAVVILLGPGFCVGFGNGLLLGYLMYRSGLVPRRMALLGSSAGP